MKGNRALAAQYALMVATCIIMVILIMVVKANSDAIERNVETLKRVHILIDRLLGDYPHGPYANPN